MEGLGEAVVGPGVVGLRQWWEAVVGLGEAVGLGEV